MKIHSGFGLALLSLLAFPALAAEPSSYADTANIEVVRLWPDVAPGSENAPPKESIYGAVGDRIVWGIAQPTLTALYAKKSNGAAVMVIPGGGYVSLHIDSMGLEVAGWLNSLGIDAFVLEHRLPDEGHRKGADVPLQDVQRGLRLIRSGAVSAHAGHSVDPKRVGVIGFSSGGNLAAILGTYYDKPVYEPQDAADKLSARPDFMILGYAYVPWPSELLEDNRHPNRDKLLATYRIVSRINAQTPPAFLFAGAMDNDVPSSHSVRIANALQNADVPAELHIFPNAGHGFGMHAAGEEKAWPELCAAWLRARGVIPR